MGWYEYEKLLSGHRKRIQEHRDSLLEARRNYRDQTEAIQANSRMIVLQNRKRFEELRDLYGKWYAIRETGTMPSTNLTKLILDKASEIDKENGVERKKKATKKKAAVRRPTVRKLTLLTTPKKPEPVVSEAKMGYNSGPPDQKKPSVKRRRTKKEKTMAGFYKKKPMTKAQIQRQAMLDLFVTPLTVGPLLAGGSILMFAMFFKLMPLITFFGLCLLLLGVGVIFTRCLTAAPKINAESIKRWKESQQLQLEQELDQLESLLNKDKTDTRAKMYLRGIRKVYGDFVKDVDEDRITPSPDFIKQIDDIFQECVGSLRNTYSLKDQSQEMPEELKKRFISRREALLKEIDASVTILSEALMEFRTMGSEDSKTRLTNLRKDMAMRLQAARNTRDQIASLDGSNMDQLEAEYAEYLPKEDK